MKMERLTKRDGACGIDVTDVNEAIVKLARYEDTGLSPESVETLMANIFQMYKIGEFVANREAEGDSCDE